MAVLFRLAASRRLPVRFPMAYLELVIGVKLPAYYVPAIDSTTNRNE